jgi:hypothetical protein
MEVTTAPRNKKERKRPGKKVKGSASQPAPNTTRNVLTSDVFIMTLEKSVIK